MLLRIFLPQEVKEGLKVLNELEPEFNKDFWIVKDYIVRMCKAHTQETKQMILQIGNARIWALDRILSVTKNLLGSGEYHLYRGIISPMGAGFGLINIFETALTKLIDNNKITERNAQLIRESLDQEIKQAG